MAQKNKHKRREMMSTSTTTFQIVVGDATIFLARSSSVVNRNENGKRENLKKIKHSKLMVIR